MIDYLDKLGAFKEACVACRKIGSDLGSYDVVLKDDVVVTEEYGSNLATVTAKFWQGSVSIPSLSLKGSGDEGFLLDGYNLYGDLGIVVSDRKSYQNTGKRIEVGTTSPCGRTIYRDRATASLSCVMAGRDLSDLYLRMGQVHALCVRPGLRSLSCPDNMRLDLYFKDGMTVKVEHGTALSFDLKLRVV